MELEFQERLPQSRKETALFRLVISIISVNLIAPTISGLEIGFSVAHWEDTLVQLPLIWLCVIILVITTQQPAIKLANQFLGSGPNSFRATMLITTLCNVFLMSLVLTVLGPWIGTHAITLDPFVHFAQKWPRNFTIALLIEALIAQPLAREGMSRYHRRMAGGQPMNSESSQ